MSQVDTQNHAQASGRTGREQWPQWQQLIEHAREVGAQSLHDLFAQEPQRAAQCSLQLPGMFLDYSKQKIRPQSLQHLRALALACDLPSAIDELFAGATLNHTEGRAALHTALRVPATATCAAGPSIQGEVNLALAQMTAVVEKIHRHEWRGYSGKAITDVVNIGVGGSDLGPFMACFALDEFRAPAAKGLHFHFASSMDGTQVSKVLQRLDPQTTLFLISSKSFTTIDTMTNAATAIEWLASEIDDRSVLMRQHIIGISASAERMTVFGIPAQNQLHLWDWVGGRYSLWSAIGLPIALLLGMAGFRQLLAGAHALDQHFAQAPMPDNLPITMALLEFWNVNFLGLNTYAVLPYDGRLKFFPNYLAQLEMESNGKSVNRSGGKVNYRTCPVLWGDVGPNAQHAFYQLLHQGTQKVSSLFIAPITRYTDEKFQSDSSALPAQQTLSLANCLAQSRLLAFGDHALTDAHALPTHLRYDGEQASSTLLLDELTPFSLGQLLALFEHKVFVMAVLWDINPFDQWGVEMGKKIAVQMQQAIERNDTQALDSSSALLVAQINKKRNACA